MKKIKMKSMVFAIVTMSILSCTKDIGVEANVDQRLTESQSMNSNQKYDKINELDMMDNSFEEGGLDHASDGIIALRRECELGADDLNVNIQWEEDCSTATISLSLCCDCFNQTGIKTGCTINPAEIFMQVQYSPSSFEVFEHDISGISIQSGECYEMRLVIENSPNIAAITQLYYNGFEFDVSDFYGLDRYCPYN